MLSHLRAVLTNVKPVITGELKSRIDRTWDSFWFGGISNPLEVIEQVTPCSSCAPQPDDEICDPACGNGGLPRRA